MWIGELPRLSAPRRRENSGAQGLALASEDSAPRSTKDSGSQEHPLSRGMTEQNEHDPASDSGRIYNLSPDLPFGCSTIVAPFISCQDSLEVYSTFEPGTFWNNFGKNPASRVSYFNFLTDATHSAPFSGTNPLVSPTREWQVHPE